MRADQIDYDSPWKEALERYFPEFIVFFFPQADAAIDWTKGHEFLDKELQQVAHEGELGRRIADKLVKVWLHEGEEAWVLVHIEVQAQEEAEFAERMFTYHYRLYDRYHRRVASLAVLGDEREGWRPETFGYELFGCEIRLRFPVAKLMDYRARWEELETNRSPFATVVMTHLKAQETRQDALERKEWKLALTRRLYEQGYGREEVLQLFRFIDWVLRLPKELEAEFWQEVQAYEEGRKMTYVTSVERIGIEKGLLQARREDVLEVLASRFEDVSEAIVKRIQGIEDTDLLRELHRQALRVKSLDEFTQLLP